MTALGQEIHEYADFSGSIGEMGGEALAPDLPLPNGFLDEIKKHDDDPMFVTVEIESGRSNNGRNWKPEHVRQVVDKVNRDRMAGNLGHPLLDPKEYDNGFPIPQVVWVAAKAHEVGGRARGHFKGYVLKGAQARELLKLKLIDSVSWFGDITARRTADGSYDVVNFKPETIDFARKGRQGMSSRVLALAGEQSRGGNGVEARDIAALSEDELRQHNPLLFAKIQTDAQAEKVGEMSQLQATLDGQKPEIDMVGEIRKLLNLQEGENPLDKLTALIETTEQAAKEGVRDFVRSIVGKKVKTKRGQDVLLRLLGGEMETWESEPLTDEKKKEIETALEEKMDKDDTIKALVGEMSGWNESPDDGGDDEGDDDDEDKPAGKTGGSRLGHRSRVGEMSGRKGDKEVVGAGSVVKKNERLVVTRRRFDR